MGLLSSNCFWDVDIEELDLVKHKKFIISRVLEHGTLGQIKELKKTYSKNEIAEVVRNSNNISRRVAMFWANLLDIPAKEVRACSRQNSFPRKPLKH